MDSVSENFFHQNNFEMLISVIDVDFKTRFGVSVHERCPDLKTIVFESMVHLFDNCSENEKTLENLNKKTLSYCIPNIVNKSNHEEKTQKKHEKEESELNVKDMATPIDSLQTVPDDIIEDINKNQDKDLNITSILKKTNELNELNKKYITNQIIDEKINNNDEKVYIDKNEVLEINSRDRNFISINNNDTPFSFSVKLDASDTHNGIGLNKGIKNIVKVSLSHIIIPNVNNNISRYPYLYLNILEFPGQFNGSSNYSTNAFAKIIRDKDWSETTNSNITFLCMYDKFSHGWISETPISSISKLTIQILTPRGEIISSGKDIFNITSITYNNSDNTFKITVENFFNSDYFNIDHVVTFYNLIFDNNIDLKNFLERSDGHVITGLNNNQNGSIYNEFYISSNTYFDITSGDTIDSFSSLSTNPINLSGLIMNSSKQTSISLHCKTRSYKNSTTAQII